MKPANFDNKLQHSIDLLRRSEALALRYYAAGFYLACICLHDNALTGF